MAAAELAEPWSCPPAEGGQASGDLDEAAARRAGHVGIALLLAWFALATLEPSEPFLVDFLISKGLTNQQVYDDVFSLWVYLRLPALLLMGSLAERFGSAPTLLLGSLFGTATVAINIYIYIYIYI